VHVAIVWRSCAYLDATPVICLSRVRRENVAGRFAWSYRPSIRGELQMSTRTVRGARIFRFGDFELHVRAAELWRTGQRVRLQEQPYRILLMLLEHPGEVVLREEIRRRLWPNDTVVEVSHGINAAVLRLREALEESAEDPRHIETVARKGYRFRGEVELVYQERTVRAVTVAGALDTGNLDGQTLGHFRIQDRLGVGGMGVVYRAEDLKLGRDVALKFLPPEQAGDPVALGRFEREARTASVLNHPSVCTVYSVEELAGQPAIAMELLEGETLEARLKRGPMGHAEALAIAVPIVAAMEAAHRKGIVHRDLKPANVVVTASGVKVVDFGLAKTALAPDVTQEGAILGTPDYMSPEQMRGEEASAASDIYAFGVMLREMTGDGASSTLSRVVARCLAHDPRDRWQSAGDLRAALELGEAPQRRRSTPVPVRAASSVAACVAVVVLLSLLRPSEHQPSRMTFPAPGAGVAGRLAVSPDGNSVAYVNNGRIWVRALGESEARPVDGAQTSGAPFWSPDGRYLAFASNGQLRAVSVGGGIPRTICNVHTNAAGVWSPSGDILIGQIGDGIFRVPASGGELVRVTQPDPAKNETRHMLPQILPGGRRFIYVAGADRAGYNALWAASLDGKDRKAILSVESGVILVTPRRGRSGYLVHMRDRALVAQPFDLEAMETTGAGRTLATGVGSVPSMGSVLLIGDFAAGGSTLAYRASASSVLTQIQNATRPLAPPSAASSGEITVLRGWM
jgi:DNA-binding winged helix-turn-helix (wHTH) protein